MTLLRATRKIADSKHWEEQDRINQRLAVRISEVWFAVETLIQDYEKRHKIKRLINKIRLWITEKKKSETE